MIMQVRFSAERETRKGQTKFLSESEQAIGIEAFEVHFGMIVQNINVERRAPNR
jgi:hypothetical protein